MPLTLSHVAAALPLKLKWPRAFDGVALVVGSTTPDLVFAAGAPIPTYGHTWAGLVVWCVPLSFALALVIRSAAPVTAAHLPGWCQDYGVLGTLRHRWFVTAASAWVGAVTHRLWDEISHDRLAGTSLGFTALSRPLLPGLPWAVALHVVFSLIGLVGCALAIAHIGRRGLLRRWHGAPPEVARRAGAFWTVAAVAMTTGAIVSALLPSGGIPIVLGARLLCAVPCAVAVAAVAVGRSPDRADRSDRGNQGNRPDRTYRPDAGDETDTTVSRSGRSGRRRRAARHR